MTDAEMIKKKADFEADIRNYLPLYIRQPALYLPTNKIGTFYSVNDDRPFSPDTAPLVAIRFTNNDWVFGVSHKEMKIILRPWTDLKVEEVEHMTWDNDPCWWLKKTKKGKVTITYDSQQPSCFRPNEYAYLCSIGIDVCYLIKRGMAIDSTTVKLPKDVIDVRNKYYLNQNT